MTDSVFIFRRDLRLVDNTGLLEASRQSGQVHVCFIWDDNIMARFTDHDFRLAFLRASLVDLAQQVSDLGGHLNILSGEPLQVLSHLLGQVKVGG